jgi:hypothetical protein
MPNDDGGEDFASGLVLGVEACQIGAVEIEHAQNPATL